MVLFFGAKATLQGVRGAAMLYRETSEKHYLDDGHYDTLWGGDPQATALGSWELNDQASVAVSYDVASHGDEPERVLRAVRDWLSSYARRLSSQAFQPT